jgi:hypothetical protein
MTYDYSTGSVGAAPVFQGNPINDVSDGYWGPKVLVQSVPEPSTWAMMMLGFAGLGFAAYRKVRPTATVA